uniref:Uncharacterized protein n=1 Tax=Glossina pallidipes TaxID=7398 RepID=A0A1A9ZL07_GLOPL
MNYNFCVNQKSVKKVSYCLQKKVRIREEETEIETDAKAETETATWLTVQNTKSNKMTKDWNIVANYLEAIVDVTLRLCTNIYHFLPLGGSLERPFRSQKITTSIKATKRVLRIKKSSKAESEPTANMGLTFSENI